MPLRSRVESRASLHSSLWVDWKNCFAMASPHNPQVKLFFLLAALMMGVIRRGMTFRTNHSKEEEDGATQ